VFKAASDPLIWELHPARDCYTEPVYREFFEAALATKMAFAFVARLDDTIIDSSRYHAFEAERREIEIGWSFLTRAYWGGGTNAEIKRLMINYAFTLLTRSFSGSATRIGARGGPWKRSAAYSARASSSAPGIPDTVMWSSK